MGCYVMREYKLHAEKLVREYKQKRAVVLSKRKKLTMNTEEEKIKKMENYKVGLAFLSGNLLSALEQYKGVLSESVPEAPCSIKIKAIYPEDIDVTFTIKSHAVRFLSRMTNKGEEFQGVLVDGMVYAESTYQGNNRKMVAQAGLWSDIGKDAWGVKGEEGEFLYFIKEILPEVMESIWFNATLSLVHS